MKTRQFFLQTLLITTTVAALSASAFGSTTVQLNLGIEQYGDGGEFTAIVSDPNNLIGANNLASLGYVAGKTSIGNGFETFCVEYNEEFGPGSSYAFGISQAATQGGASTATGAYYNSSTGLWSDPVSVGTAWLYRQFATGNLANYVYTDPNSAAALQAAIWYLEGEQPNTNIWGVTAIQTLANKFISEAATGTGLSLVLTGGGGVDFTQGLAGNEVNDQYGVSVLNVGTGPTFPNQDQLVLTPGFQASSGSVPDGGETIAMLGVALLGLGVFRYGRRMRVA